MGGTTPQLLKDLLTLYTCTNIFLSLDPMTSVFEGNACSFVGVFPLKSKEIVFEFFSS